MFSGRIVWNFKKLIIGLLVYVVYASVCAGRISGQESLLLAGENGPGRGVSNRPSSSGFSGEQLPELLAAAEPPVDDDDDDDEDDSFEISENFSATGSKVWGRASVKGKKIELGGKELYQVLQVVVTVPRIKPGTFKKKWTKQYARVMASELETLIHKPVKVRVTGVQGEDTGSGVFTQILIGERVSGEVLTFLTDEFIKKDTGTMFKGMFGEAVHIEAFADTCIMGSDFEDALEDTPQLVPTLHASIALEDRKATRKNMKFYCPRVAKALRTWLEKNGAASTSTYDFFVDNDEKLGKDKDRGGHKSKPVCNVIIQGPLKEDLVRLQDLIRSIGGYRGKKTKQNVLFSSSLRLGKVHVEGGSLIPAVCGSLPSHVIAQKAPVGTDLDRSVLARRSLFALRSLHVLTLSLAPRASLVRQVIKEVDYVPGATSATLMVAEPTTGKRPFKLNGLAFTSGEPPVTCPCHCPCKATGGRTSVMIHSCPFPEKALNASRVYSFSVAGTDGSENPLPVSYAENTVTPTSPSPTSPSPTSPSPTSPSPTSPSPTSPMPVTFTPNPTPTPTPPVCASPPTAPGGLTVTAGTNSLGMSWSAVTDPTATNLEAFCVASGGTCSSTTVGSTLNTATNIGTTTSYTVASLTAATPYDCFVKVTNACGSTCSTGTSQTVSGCVAPAAPTNVVATPDHSTTGKMTVTWDYAAQKTWAVRCVDNTGSAATCTGASAGVVAAFTCTSSPCSAAVTSLADNTPYICCVVATDTVSSCTSAPAASASATTCTTLTTPTISSVVASAAGELTVSWSAQSNAVSYDYFCAAGTGQACTASPAAGSTYSPAPPVSSSPGAVSGLSAGSYTCFVKSTNSCSNPCSAGAPGVVCSITAPTSVTVTGATASQLDLSWSAVTSPTVASTYKAFCVLRNPQTGTATQTCADTPQGSGVVTVNHPTVSASITGLAANTKYVCYVKAVDSSSCNSACTSGTEYVTSQVGTSSMLTAPTLTTLVFDDGDGPNQGTFPTEKRTELPFDETTCTNENEFPDKRDPTAAQRALQIILNVEGHSKTSYEASIDVQAKFYKALSDLSLAIGTGPVCMRTFNVDNSRHGAGVKTRMWFDTQTDCIAFANYVRARWGPSGDGVLQNSMGTPNTFRDINKGTNNQFATNDFGLPSYTYNGAGGVTIRMITNPQSKCHKWKFPSSSVCTAQLSYFTPGATTRPANPVRNSDTNTCEDQNGDTMPGGGNNSAAGGYIIFALSARYKQDGTGTTGYLNDATFRGHVYRAFKDYFRSLGWSDSTTLLEVGIELRPRHALRDARSATSLSLSLTRAPRSFVRSFSRSRRLTTVRRASASTSGYTQPVVTRPPALRLWRTTGPSTQRRLTRTMTQG